MKNHQHINQSYIIFLYIVCTNKYHIMYLDFYIIYIYKKQSISYSLLLKIIAIYILIVYNNTYIHCLAPFLPLAYCIFLKRSSNRYFICGLL
jgi:hypothetical protein